MKPERCQGHTFLDPVLLGKNIFLALLIILDPYVIVVYLLEGIIDFIKRA